MSHPEMARLSRWWGPRVTVIIAVTSLLLAGCGDGKKTTAEDVKGSVTTSTLFVTDGQPDACGVFTQDEVQGFTGNPVAKGTDTGAGQGCYFAAENDGRALLVNLQNGDSAAKFADSKSNTGAQTSNVQSVPDAGYDAFVYAPQEGGLAGAEARKGTIRVRVVITGANATVEMAKSALIAAIPKISVD